MTYKEEVQEAVNVTVAMAERAEAANQGELSSWYGSVCNWIREQEKQSKSFCITLPDPATGGEPLTVIEVRTSHT